MKRIALFLAPLMLAACLPDPFGTRAPDVKIDPDKTERTAAVIELADPGSGEKVRLHVADTLILSVESNPTTGYFWTDPEQSPALLELTGSDYVADPAPEGIVGSGGRHVFSLTAMTAGETQLKLSYQRSPEDVAETENPQN